MFDEVVHILVACTALATVVAAHLSFRAFWSTRVVQLFFDAYAPTVGRRLDQERYLSEMRDAFMNQRSQFGSEGNSAEPILRCYMLDVAVAHRTSRRSFIDAAFFLSTGERLSDDIFERRAVDSLIERYVQAENDDTSARKVRDHGLTVSESIPEVLVKRHDPQVPRSHRHAELEILRHVRSKLNYAGRDFLPSRDEFELLLRDVEDGAERENIVVRYRLLIRDNKSIDLLKKYHRDSVRFLAIFMAGAEAIKLTMVPNHQRASTAIRTMS